MLSMVSCACRWFCSASVTIAITFGLALFLPPRGLLLLLRLWVRSCWFSTHSSRGPSSRCSKAFAISVTILTLENKSIAWRGNKSYMDLSKNIASILYHLLDCRKRSATTYKLTRALSSGEQSWCDDAGSTTARSAQLLERAVSVRI